MPSRARAVPTAVPEPGAPPEPVGVVDLTHAVLIGAVQALLAQAVVGLEVHLELDDAGEPTSQLTLVLPDDVAASLGVDVVPLVVMARGYTVDGPPSTAEAEGEADA